MAPISELRDVTAALRVVGERQEKAKNRMNPIVSQQAVYNTVVQLSLPAHATPELSFGGAKEVIAIENRNLAPLSSSGVLSLFKGLDTPKQLTEEGTNHESLPAPSSSTESHSEALSIKQIADGARRFLDSMHPAPFASTF
jgi:hypothetical protein